MKKLILITMLIFSIATTEAQGIQQIPIETVNGDVSVCLNQFNTVEFYTSCTDQYYWLLDGEVINATTLVIVHNNEQYFEVGYSGCGLEIGFILEFINPQPMPTPFTQEHWKKPGDTKALQAVASDSLNMYHYIWSTGETSGTIIVSEPGTYSCEIFDDYECGTTIRTYIVYDMAELSVANTDPVTGQIYLQWEVEESVAQNATELQIFRGSDTLVPIATVNYADGIWTDPDAENTAARTYRVRTVAYDGLISPISEQKQTIHMNYNLSYFDDIINLDWNIPAGYELEWFIVNQLVYTKDGPNIIAFDSVTPDINSMSVPLNKFENDGKVFIEGRVRGEKRDRLSPYSNPTDEEILGVEEYSQNSDKLFDIFPNPAKGLFTVRATGKITITTILGQVVLVQNVDGEKNIELPKGEYVVTYDGESRVIVVE